MTLTIQARRTMGDFSLDVDFVSESGITALFGRSGSGKTSIVRIIAGLERPEEQRVVFGEHVLADSARGIHVPVHKRHFGYVFQEHRLFPHLSVRRNLAYGRWFARQRDDARNFERIVELLGIEALLERAPGTLSGGEKQRVSVGRALLSSPRLLLMDEPLSGLDEERKQEILPYLEALRDRMKIPIIYVSHSVSEVTRLADKVVVVSAGRVVSSGSVSEVLSQPSFSLAATRRETGVVLEGHVTRFDHTHRLNTVALKNIEIIVPGGEGPAGRRVRVHIPARDVMLAKTPPLEISALNVLPGRVIAVKHVEAEMADVSVICGEHVIHSLITQFSCKRLSLAPGMDVYAIIKSVALGPA